MNEHLKLILRQKSYNSLIKLFISLFQEGGFLILQF
jgi:hypothetical protein